MDGCSAIVARAEMRSTRTRLEQRHGRANFSKTYHTKSMVFNKLRQDKWSIRSGRSCAHCQTSLYLVFNQQFHMRKLRYLKQPTSRKSWMNMAKVPVTPRGGARRLNNTNAERRC